MPRSILIPEDEEQPLVEIETPDLASMQAAVGGSIELVTLLKANSTLVIDEEGKAKHRGLNQRATLLWWLNQPSAQNHDVIVGDALLAGHIDRAGNLRDIGSIADTLLWERSFHVKVRYAPNARWETYGPALSNYFAAARRALRLRSVDGWQRTRVVTAE